MSNNESTASTGIPEPTTPENATIDLPTDSTPTVHKRSTAIPYSSTHIHHDDTLKALGDETVGYVVGPMPANEFLELLPCNTEKLPSFDKKKKLLFAKLAEQTTEFQMYDPFVRTISFSFLNP